LRSRKIRSINRRTDGNYYHILISCIRPSSFTSNQRRRRLYYNILCNRKRLFIFVIYKRPLHRRLQVVAAALDRRAFASSPRSAALVTYYTLHDETIILLGVPIITMYRSNWWVSTSRSGTGIVGARRGHDSYNNI